MATVYIEEKSLEFYEKLIALLKTGEYTKKEMQEKLNVTNMQLRDKLTNLKKCNIIDTYKVGTTNKYFIIADEIEIIIRNDMGTAYKQQVLDDFLRKYKKIKRRKLIDFGAEIGYPHSCLSLIQYAQRKGVEVIL